MTDAPFEDDLTEVQRYLVEVSQRAHAVRSAPVWTDDFWDGLEEAEKVAQNALGALWEASEDGSFCSCETCIVRTVLEAVLPAFTSHAMGLLGGEDAPHGD